MASLMKTLMDDFHEYSVIEKDDGHFEEGMLFEQFVSYANNCHQLSNEQIFKYLNNMVEMTLEQNPHMENTLNIISEIIDSYK